MTSSRYATWSLPHRRLRESRTWFPRQLPLCLRLPRLLLSWRSSNGDRISRFPRPPHPRFLSQRLTSRSRRRCPTSPVPQVLPCPLPNGVRRRCPQKTCMRPRPLRGSPSMLSCPELRKNLRRRTRILTMPRLHSRMPSSSSSVPKQAWSLLKHV